MKNRHVNADSHTEPIDSCKCRYLIGENDGQLKLLMDVKLLPTTLTPNKLQQIGRGVSPKTPATIVWMYGAQGKIFSSKSTRHLKLTISLGMSENKVSWISSEQ